MSLIFPFCAAIGLGAHTIIPVIFGAQWSSAVPVFQALCLVAALDASFHLPSIQLEVLSLFRYKFVLQSVFAFALWRGYPAGSSAWGHPGRGLCIRRAAGRPDLRAACFECALDEGQHALALPVLVSRTLLRRNPFSDPVGSTVSHGVLPVAGAGLPPVAADGGLAGYADRRVPRLLPAHRLRRVDGSFSPGSAESGHHLPSPNRPKPTCWKAGMFSRRDLLAQRSPLDPVVD